MDERTISVGQLRQNPTAMIRAVRAGQHWTVTDRGVPVADVIPHVARQWTPIGTIAEALQRVPFDGELAAELDAMRDAETMADPWSRS
jgi:prevent-host-death family protein